MNEQSEGIMRAARLVNIMLLLKARNGMTARELSQKLEVSQRTIYRDIDALGMAGVPVYTQRGEYGGCFLDEHYHLTLQDLNDTELETLFIRGGAEPLSAIGLKKHIEGSRLKLISTLSPIQQQMIERMQNRIYIDTQNWFQQVDDTTHLSALRQAVWASQTLEMDYERFNGEQSTQVIIPYGLVVKANIWYLVGQANTQDNPRIYRISRIKSLKMLDEIGMIPNDFDLQTYWHLQQDKFKGRMTTFKVQVRVTSDMFDTLKMLSKERLEESSRAREYINGHEWVRVNVHFHDDNEARAILMSFGNRIYVEHPKSLRESIITYAQSICEMYNLQ